MTKSRDLESRVNCSKGIQGEVIPQRTIDIVLGSQERVQHAIQGWIKAKTPKPDDRLIGAAE